MKEIITSNVFFGISLTFIAYNIALIIKKKTKLTILNPLLVSILLVIGVLVIGDIDYQNYTKGSQYISYLLTPTTVCLAVPLYENLHILKTDFKAISAGIISGLITSAMTVLPLAILFKLSHENYVSLLPKSITSAIGMVLSKQFGGIVPITIIIIILTGIFGSIISDYIFKIFKITSPVAQGIALGSSAHAMGTSKAFELGEKQGAIASLSLSVSGILTALVISFFVNLY